jgi:hypothetical protein
MVRKDAEREIIREWIALPGGAVRFENEAQVSLRQHRRRPVPRNPTDDASASQADRRRLKVI